MNLQALKILQAGLSGLAGKSFELKYSVLQAVGKNLGQCITEKANSAYRKSNCKNGPLWCGLALILVLIVQIVSRLVLVGFVFFFTKIQGYITICLWFHMIVSMLGLNSLNLLDG